MLLPVIVWMIHTLILSGKYMPLLMMYSLKVPKKAFMNTTIIKTARNMRISW